MSQGPFGLQVLKDAVSVFLHVDKLHLVVLFINIACLTHICFDLLQTALLLCFAAASWPATACSAMPMFAWLASFVLCHVI